MLEALTRRVLRWTGKEHLAPFIQGLVHLGRPSTVLFPRELLEQGAAIALSGLSNTMAIQSNPEWVWPLWVEQQTDPDQIEFVPTGLNLFTTNVTTRNWTSLGVDGSPVEAMVDPVGMITPRPYGWSLLPYLRVDDSLFVPPREKPRCHQELREGTLPSIVTRYDADPGLAWSQEATAVEIEGEEGIVVVQRIENIGTHRREFRLGIALRPYNPLMLGHINRLRLKRQLWRVNGRAAVLLLDPPSRSQVSDRHKGDPLFTTAQGVEPLSLHSRSGIASGTNEWFLSLAPGQIREIVLFLPLRKSGTHRPQKFIQIRREPLLEAREATLGKWREHQGSGTEFVIPDPEVARLLAAIRNRLPAFDDGDIFTPGTFLYHEFWFRDGAFLATGFENLGHGHRVAPKLRHFRKRQRSDGFYCSQDGEWDSNGQAIWTAIQHVRRGGDPALLETLWSGLWQGARWIDNFRQTTTKLPSAHFGLLPAGFSAEHFGPNDHYYWDNFWSIAGLRELLWAARTLGKEREADILEERISRYRIDLESSIAGSLERTGGAALPPSPYRHPDAASVGNLVAISPLRLCDVSTSWVRPTVEKLMRENRRDGLFFQSIVHTGLNPYLSAQLARSLLVLEDCRWLDILHGLVRTATSTGCWPEAIHPRTGGGCMGDGDHGWSAAEFVSILREAFVREEESSLILGGGIPLEWLKEGCSIHGATTEAGTVSVKFIPAGTLRIEWSCTRKPHQDLRSLVLSVPQGGSRHRIALSGQTGTIELDWNILQEVCA
ncbi:MAG: hypothetical protein RL318_1198 [Fibrobacterota bacterium]|jgi:hypothetical protein